jgi:hypothetical protein
MLYLGAVTYDQSKEHARVFRERKSDDYNVEAFHWGSLTSGDWKTAYWVLLTPFLLANVAGWMGRNSSPWFRFSVRLAGAGLTALLAVEMLIVAIDIPLAWARETSNPVGTVQLLVVAVFLAFLLVVLVLSTQSHFSHLGWRERFTLTFVPTVQAMLPGKYRKPSTEPDGQWTDPGESVLTDGRNWDVHASLHRLRRIHLTVGILMMSITVSVGRAQSTQTVVAGVGVALMIGLLWWTSFRPQDTMLKWLTAVAPASAVLMLGWVTLDMASGFPEGNIWPNIHKLNFYSAMALGVASVLIILGEATAGIRGKAEPRPSLATAGLPVAAITLAALIGSSLGIAFALVAEAFMGVHHVAEQGAEWVSIAMLGLVALLSFVTLWLMLSPVRPSAIGLIGRKGAGIRKAVYRGRVVFYAAALYALAFGVVAWWKGCDWTLDCDPARLGSWPDKWNTNVLPTIMAFGKSINLGDLADVAQLLVVLAPAFFVARNLLLKARDADRRRQIGILWDVGSFWPRAFHPLGPPAYGPAAVDRLQGALERPDSAYVGIVTREEPRWKDLPSPTGGLDLLSAHSQGTLVSAVALDRLVDKECLPSAFLTYGSQLGMLYPLMFPHSGIDDLVVRLQHHMPNRWINLWRDSDPIGGQPAVSLDSANWQVTTGRGHSLYELTPEFCQARKTLGGGSTDRPTGDVGNCWDKPYPI